MIEFTQYLRPDGRQRKITIDLPEVQSKADAIIAAGFVFEIEVLSEGTVSATISDDLYDHSNVLASNSPDVPAAIAAMIMDFDIDAAAKQRLVAQ